MAVFHWNRSRLLIILSCAVGMIAGVVVADLVDVSLISLVRRVFAEPVLTVWSGLQVLFLFLITAMAVNIHAFPILLTTGFLASLRLGSNLWLAVRAYGTAAWLVQPLTQFSGNLLTAGFWFFLFQYGEGRAVGRREWVFAGIYIAVVTIIDVLAVTPFRAAVPIY